MKKLSELLKKSAGKPLQQKLLDEKTARSVFFKIAQENIKGLCDADIKRMTVKNSKFYVVTASPVVAAEIFRHREKIKRGMNELLGEECVSKITVK